jgi:hypothetical protein
MKSYGIRGWSLETPRELLTVEGVRFRLSSEIGWPHKRPRRMVEGAWIEDVLIDSDGAPVDDGTVDPYWITRHPDRAIVEGIYVETLPRLGVGWRNYRLRGDHRVLGPVRPRAARPSSRSKDPARTAAGTLAARLRAEGRSREEIYKIVRATARRSLGIPTGAS